MIFVSGALYHNCGYHQNLILYGCKVYLTQLKKNSETKNEGESPMCFQLYKVNFHPEF
jgi:hypothetical protein